MTTTYAALLRGINVGGKRVPMTELRTLLEGLGHTSVRTYLQSGNAVFTSDETDQEKLAADLERALEKHFGFTVACLVRDGGYLRAVQGACPFPAATLQGRQLHATFFAEPVRPSHFEALDQQSYLPEEFRLGDRVLYLYAPDGVGRSKLAEALNRPAVLGRLLTTSRNWNTVTKLVEMTAA